MKIKKIVTSHFKNAPDMELYLDKINVLTGENGKGKSSMLHALRYALNGKLPEDPIRHGTDSVSVKAVLDDGQNTTLERVFYVSDAFQINGKEEKEKFFQKEAQKYHQRMLANGGNALFGKNTNPYFLKQNPEVFWQFFETGRIENTRIHGIKEAEVTLPDGTSLYCRKSQPSKLMIDGKKATAKATRVMLENRMQGDAKGLDLILSSEVLGAIESSDFTRYLIGMIPVQCDFENLSVLANLTQEEKSVLEPLFPKAPNPIAVSDVASAYKKLFTMRADLGREKEEWYKKSLYAGTVPNLNKRSVQEKLKEIQGKLGAAGQIQNAWKVYEVRKQERQQAVDTLKKWIQEYNSMGDIRSVDERRYHDLIDEERNLQNEIIQDKQMEASMAQQNQLLEKMLHNLDTAICPLCDSLVCTTDKSSCRADLENSIRNNKGILSKNHAQIKRKEERLKSIRMGLEQMREADALWKQKVSLYQKIESYKKNLPQMPEMPETLPDTKTLIAESQNYEQALQEVTLYENCKKAEENYHTISETYDLYHQLVLKCEPKKGLLTQMILKLVLDPFKDHCNSFLKSVYGNYEVKFEMTEEGLKIYAKTRNNPFFTLVQSLSKGEKMLVIMALMDMVSSVANSRLLCFDDLEQFDSETIDQLMKLLTRPEIMQRYDHILLAPVNHNSITEIMKKYQMQVNIVSL